MIGQFEAMRPLIGHHGAMRPLIGQYVDIKPLISCLFRPELTGSSSPLLWAPQSQSSGSGRGTGAGGGPPGSLGYTEVRESMRRDDGMRLHPPEKEPTPAWRKTWVGGVEEAPTWSTNSVSIVM